jgi:hypothetical protein
VRQGGVIGQVVDRDDLDVGVVAEFLLRIQRPEKVAPDAAEAVNAYPDRHLSLHSLSACVVRMNELLATSLVACHQRCAGWWMNILTEA